MPEEFEEVFPREDELAAGFSAQTLSYPDTYELPKLGNERRMRHERAVAVEIDPNNRIKRCRTNNGYVHEALAGDEWCEGQRFSSLAEVIGSEMFMAFRRRTAESRQETEDHD